MTSGDRIVRKVAFGAAGALAAAAALFILLQTQRSGSSGYVPLPKLPSNGTIELRVAFIENPRLTTYSAAEWQQVLDTTRDLTQEHFGLDVAFTDPVPLSLEDVFDRLDNNLSDAHKDHIAGLDPDRIDWNRMTEAILPTLPTHDEGLSAAFETVKAHTGARYSEMTSVALETRRRQLALILADLLKEKLAAYRSGDSAKAIQESERPGRPGYNEWIYWDALPSLSLPYDIYLTNQPVISAEYSHYPIHAVISGGVTAGTTSGATQGQFGTAAWVTNFFDMASDPVYAAIRGGPETARTQAIRMTALTLTHEIGHVLFHFGHPWENPSCIMTPSRFESAEGAFRRIDANACQIGSSPDMTPGAARIPAPYFKEMDR
ncbi:MAG: hypothetical protein JJ881_13445 [Alphaproteobacteria bacterium]|nr:hypothetical protein [Alphaproteobacteria bacterium]